MRDLLVRPNPAGDALPQTRCAECGFTWTERGAASLPRCPRCHSASIARELVAPPEPPRPRPIPQPAAPPVTSAQIELDRPLVPDRPNPFPAAKCRLCDDAGLLVTTDARGNHFAKDCECRIAARNARVLADARIPRRYEFCSLDHFEDHRSESISTAWRTARDFSEKFPFETAGKGLLLTGPPGLGKTHLAVSILRHVIERGVAKNGFFYEHKELLERLRSFYDLRSAGAENNLLRTLITCDLLILDDLGEVMPSDWVWDTTAYILNARYNENLSTIITTNRPNEAALVTRPGEENSQLAAARLASKRETLGDRIGDRMRSRLMEMCVHLHLHGAPDFRETGKRATFGRL